MSYVWVMYYFIYWYKASAQMTQTSGQTLYTAKSISNTLANSLTEREREMVF
jgi:diguanylate cyclase